MTIQPIKLEHEGHLINKIYEGIRKKNIENAEGHEVKRNWSPTDTDKCPRQLWYAWRNFPIEYTDEELAIFAIGHFTHDYLQKILESIGAQLCAEFRVETNWNGFPVAGYVDSVVFNQNEGLCVVDFKTIKDNGLGFVKNAAKMEHNKQVQLYMDVLKLKKGYVLYWGKGTGKMVQQIVDYDPKIIKEILQLFKLVQKHLDEDTLPKSVFNEKDWKCAYCKYKYYCQEGVKEIPFNGEVNGE